MLNLMPQPCQANGVPLVICPLGDGWLYAYDCRNGKIIWKFDSNNKETTYPSQVPPPDCASSKGQKMYATIASTPNAPARTAYR